MYHIPSSIRIASRKSATFQVASGKSVFSRTFATAKQGKSIYRRLVTPTIVCAAGGALYYFYTHPFDKEHYLYTLDNPTAYELESLTPKQIAAHTFLMNRTFSRLIGRAMNLTLPESWRKPIYSKVSQWIGINVDEFEGDFKDYPTPNSFFTRDLKENVRPIIRCEDLLLSPVDGTVSVLEEHLPTDTKIQLHQVKGVRYDLTEFMGKPLHLEDPSNHLYAAVIYLSPSNYHHIHSPCDATISERVHVPGVLLPVKSYYATKVKGLFTLNERVVLNGHWKEGFFSLGMVGAFNVGSIRITNPNDPITTNLPHELLYKNHKHCRVYEEAWAIDQGKRCGTFELGSTIVMAFEAPHFTWLVQPGDKVCMGQPIGYVNYTEAVENITEVVYPEALKEGLMKLEAIVNEVEGLVQNEGGVDVDVEEVEFEEVEGGVEVQEVDVDVDVEEVEGGVEVQEVDVEVDAESLVQSEGKIEPEETRCEVEGGEVEVIYNLKEECTERIIETATNEESKHASTIIEEPEEWTLETPVNDAEDEEIW